MEQAQGLQLANGAMLKRSGPSLCPAAPHFVYISARINWVMQFEMKYGLPSMSDYVFVHAPTPPSSLLVSATPTLSSTTSTLSLLPM